MNEQDSQIKIVGIGGLPRSGKDKLAELLMNSGYFGVSFGDIVRVFSRSRHEGEQDPISVKNMTETSNWLRQTKGPDFALQEALKLYEEASKTKEYKGLLVYSLRAPVEVDFVLAHHGKIIWIESSDELRHQRSMNDLREGEIPITLEEMLSQEAKQWTPQPDLQAEVQMNVSYTKDHATTVFENDSNDIAEFNSRAKELIAEL